MGLKEEKKVEMYALSPDRKKFLLRQNRQFKSSTSQAPSQPIYPASYGPASAAALLPKLVPQLTGDAGLIRRFSIVGWGSGTTPAPAVVSSDSRNSGEFSRTLDSHDQVSKLSEEIQPLQPQTTGGLWSNWWASSGGDKSSEPEKSGKELAKSTKWYIDGLRIGKAPDIKQVKHLITLRVHLSTAKLAFIQDFVGVEKGLVALGKLLAGLVGKGGKRKTLTELETTILLEVLKCLRVLLNTEASKQLGFESRRTDIHL